MLQNAVFAHIKDIFLRSTCFLRLFVHRTKTCWAIFSRFCSTVFSSCLLKPQATRSLNLTSCWANKTQDRSRQHRRSVKKYLYNINNPQSCACPASQKVAKQFKMSRSPWMNRWLSSPQIFHQLSPSLASHLSRPHTDTPAQLRSLSPLYSLHHLLPSFFLYNNPPSPLQILLLFVPLLLSASPAVFHLPDSHVFSDVAGNYV